MWMRECEEKSEVDSKSEDEVEGLEDGPLDD
jgi:hypothetical protein